MPKMEITAEKILLWGGGAISLEAEGLKKLAASLDTDFVQAARLVTNTKGRIGVTGVGKSGHVGRKIAATLSSTGRPAAYIHPTEASHGDLGMIGLNDTIIAISKSGETSELEPILQYCRRFGVPVIGITGNRNSTLGKLSTRCLELPESEEACPLGLSPTTSSTMTLALGDALAIVSLQMRKFKSEDFKKFHPGGALGLKLTEVRDVMRKGSDLPIISVNQTLEEAIFEMTRAKIGCVGVTAQDEQLIGIFTDGDLRRHFSSANLGRRIREMMTTNPYKVHPNDPTADILRVMSKAKIPSVFVCHKGHPVGVVHIHDLIQRGFV